MLRFNQNTWSAGVLQSATIAAKIACAVCQAKMLTIDIYGWLQERTMYGRAMTIYCTFGFLGKPLINGPIWTLVSHHVQHQTTEAVTKLHVLFNTISSSKNMIVSEKQRIRWLKLCVGNSLHMPITRPPHKEEAGVCS